MPDIFDVDADEPVQPQPFSDGSKPGWYAFAPDGMADDRRFDRYVDIQKAIDAGRLGLRADKGQLTARFLSPEGWMTDEQNRHRQKIERRLATGEFTINAQNQVVCAFCGGNCGQCGNTGLTDVNGVSMDAMIYNLQSMIDPIGEFKREVVKAVVKNPWGFAIHMCFSAGLVLFLLVWYDVLVHYLRHIGVIN